MGLALKRVNGTFKNDFLNKYNKTEHSAIPEECDEIWSLKQWRKKNMDEKEQKE